MSGTMTLVEFLLARITDEEANAHDEGNRSTEPGMWSHWALSVTAAHRRIIELHHASEGQLTNQGPVCAVCAYGLGGGWDLAMDCREDFPCATVKLLALPYADHPDYDHAWRL